MSSPYQIELEFTRTRETDDPYGFTFAPQTYILRTSDERTRDFAVAWDRELLEKLAALQRSSVDSSTTRALGAMMRRILEPAGWDTIESRLLEEVHAERSVHVTIRSAAAELYALPWELLTLQDYGLPLGAIPRVLVRYEWPATSTRPSAFGPRGRVMVAWSDAGGEVPHEKHLKVIRRTTGDPPRVIAGASIRALADALTEAERGGEPVDVLHLLCHGSHVDGGGLVLHAHSNADGAVVVHADEPARALVPHADMLRLVVIAACSAGDSSVPASRLGGVAQMLHRAGVQAVVASRLPLTIAGSTRLTRALFESLYLQRESLEEAVLSAKRSLSVAVGDDHDWAALQFYARAEDGCETDILGLRGARGAGESESPRSASPLQSPESSSRAVGPLADATVLLGDGGARSSVGGWMWPVVVLISVALVCVTLLRTRANDEAAASRVVVSRATPTPDPVTEGVTRVVARSPSSVVTASTPGPSSSTTASNKPTRRRRAATVEPTLELSMLGQRQLDECLQPVGCRARFVELRDVVGDLLPAIERCFFGLAANSFVDINAERGTRWTLAVDVDLAPSGALHVAQVKSRSRAPTPAACVERVIAAATLSPDASGGRYRLEFGNRDSDAALRYAGWRPEVVAAEVRDEGAAKRSWRASNEP